MTTIGEHATSAEHKPVYRRGRRGLYIKLNEHFHVKTKLSDNKACWLGDDIAEELDPSEPVELLQ